MNSDVVKDVNKSINDALGSAGTWRTIGILIGAIAVAYVLSLILTRSVVWIAQKIAVSADTASNEERVIQLRRVETYLSVTTAIMRMIIIAVVVFYALRLLSPQTSGLLTTIGAGTFFAVIATATVSPLLRDISAGSIMIAERWFSVGDFIRIEPFGAVSGVVERVTLRSTRLRNINGEVIWVHNQYIQGVKTTPRGVRTIAVDIFVRNLKAGLALVEDVRQTLPTGPTMLAHSLQVEEKEQLAKDLWRITLEGQTAPGREWLIEEFIANALKAADEDQSAKKHIIVYGPLVRNADETAERRFRRAVRVAKEESTGQTL